MEATAPFSKGARVRKSERFVVHETQSGPLELLVENGLRRQAAAGKYVSLDEIDGAAIIVEMLLPDGDHLKDCSPTGLEATRDLVEVGRPPRFADRLGHFDRDDAVVAALDVPVVLQPQIELRCRAASSGEVAGELQLSRREGQPGNV